MNVALPALDPFYEDSPLFHWLRERLQRSGVTLRVDSRVRTLIAADRPTNTLLLPPGHPILEAYKLVCQGSLYLQNPVWAEEFTERRPRGTYNPAAPTLRLMHRLPGD